MKFAYKLAKNAIFSQISSANVIKATKGEICVICLEETKADRMFSNDKCLYRHCFSCVNQFVEVKLCGGKVPTCLDDGCKLELTLENLWDDPSNNFRACVKCSGLFCIGCKYKKLHSEPLVNELMLKFLAKDQKWRQCVSNHKYCRYGYQFCYKCGVEWKEGQMTCPTGCTLTDH
ncbi:hypothetical protein EUTSA_v10002765mg, partial [Eutrema salsugineum]